MPVTVEDLKQLFPAPGEDFILSADLFELPELYDLLGNGRELVLRATEVLEEQLTVIGTVAVLGGLEARLALRFAADDANRFVTGLTAGIDAAEGEVLDVVELATVWALDLTEAPRAFLAEVQQLTAQYDLTADRVAITAETERLRIVFSAPSVGAGLVGLVGVKDRGALLSQLPYVGAEIPGGDEIGVHGVEVIVVGPDGITAAQGAAVNAAVAEAAGGGTGWWPLLPEQDLAGGLWVGAVYQLPEEDPRAWAVRLTVPDTSWVPGFPSVALGRFTLSGLGLRWSPTGDIGLRVGFDLSLAMGWLPLRLPEAGFDFPLPDSGALPALAGLPSLALSLGGRELVFTVPTVPLDLPGFPGLPGPGVLTAWWDGSWDGRLRHLLELFGFELPSLPDIFDPQLPPLGLRFDLGAGDFELVGARPSLRFVFAGLPSGPDWGKAALLGVGGLEAWLGDLPFVGDLLANLDGFGLNGVSLVALGSGIGRPQLDLLNGWIDSFPGSVGDWWPTLDWEFSGGGGGRPGWSLDMDWRLPGAPAAKWGIPWPPPSTPSPDLSWLELPDLDLGPIEVSRIGLSWPGPDEIDWSVGADWVLRLVLDARFTFGGGITLGLPGLGFDIDLKSFRVHPRFPSLSLTLPGGVTLTFDVPTVPGPPWPIALTARWQDEQGIPATDLMMGLGADIAGAVIPEQLMPRLYSAGLHFNFATYLLVVTSTTDYFGWMFAAQPVNRPDGRNLVAVRGTVQVEASQLPIIVEPTDPDHDITIGDIQFARAGVAKGASAQRGWTAAEIAALNSVLAELGADQGTKAGGVLPVLPTGDFAPGAMIWAKLHFDNKRLLDLVWPADRKLPMRGGSGVVLGRERAEEEAGKDKELGGYAIGPVRFHHAGLGYAFGRLFIALDATMAIGPLTVELLGLGFGVDKDWNVAPVLRGAGVALERPGPPRVVVAGAFTRLDLGEEFELAFAAAGRLEIQDLITLQLAGSWARNRAGWDSIFAYAELVAGKNRVNGLFTVGPVTVTGIALGFGINSTVRIPTTGELGAFPLVKRLGAKPAAPGGEVAKLSPAQALNELVGPGGWVTPAQGQYWVAGGMEFTVYRFIQARALALVEWGQAGWKAMLAGSTTLSLPPTMIPDDSEARATTPGASNSLMRPIGQVIVDFVYVYDSALGRFSMDTVIAQGSYLLDPDAALTGGISLYVWGKDLPNRPGSKGFVLSAGGYHPQFNVPDHYPKPPRIGWLWERGPITIKGQAYAALTDGAFMVGGSLAAVFDAGDKIKLQAWFTAYVDALVQWKPFYADLALGLSIGVAATVKVLFVRVRVSLEVGVDLHLWLPPIGGRARVKVWFVSFSINFGAERKGAPPVPWEDFHVQLPAPSRTSLKQGGELPDVTEDESEARRADAKPELVRLDGFTAAVESALPASKITLNGKTFAGSDAARIDIRPMGLTGVVCEQIVEILDQRSERYDWEGTAGR